MRGSSNFNRSSAEDRRRHDRARAHERPRADLRQRADAAAGLHVPPPKARFMPARTARSSRRTRWGLARYSLRPLEQGRGDRPRGPTISTSGRTQDHRPSCSGAIPDDHVPNPALPTARSTSPSTSRRISPTSSRTTRPSSLSTAPSDSHDPDHVLHAPVSTPRTSSIDPYQGPAADKRVRQAISSAIDADEIYVKTVLDGKAQRVAAMLPSMHFGFDPHLKPIKADAAKTKKLLADAGFPNGVDIAFNGPQGRYVRDKEVAEAVAGQLAKAGVRTTLKTFDYVSYLTPSCTSTRLAGRGHRLGPPSDQLLRGHLHRRCSDRAACSRTITTPISTAWWTRRSGRIDDKKRLEIYQRVNELSIEDAAAVPLYQQVNLCGGSNGSTGRRAATSRSRPTRCPSRNRSSGAEV